jgi:ABC-type sugar transport system ATPase subunit
LSTILTSNKVNDPQIEGQMMAYVQANTSLYLFDEPLSDLDPKLRAQVRRDIIMVHRAKKKPSLYVTHDQPEALAIGDRIAIIANGQLPQVGSVDNLIQHLANMFVAGFFGTLPKNLLPGMVVRESAQVRLENGTALQLPERWR